MRLHLQFHFYYHNVLAIAVLSLISRCPLSETQQRGNEITISSGCGYQNPNGLDLKEAREIFDNQTKFGEFPWMVALLASNNDNPNQMSFSYKCGGSLLAPSVVLSAAHCVWNMKPDTLIARAGEWQRNSNIESLPHQDRAIREIIVHEAYTDDAYEDNIALLLVQGEFVLATHIQPICLAVPVQRKLHHLHRYECYATGWGALRHPEDDNAEILKKIALPIVPRKKCQRMLRRTHLGKQFQLSKDNICAGGELNKDTCRGDGGSPLVCPMPGSVSRFMQAGIVSWGSCECGVKHFPGVYTNVAYMKPWILDKLSDHNVDLSNVI